jgi:hypothetical protein
MSKKFQSKTDAVFFLILLSIVTVVMYVLFYRQCLGGDALYPSDMKAYIMEMQGLDSGYRFPYPVLFMVSAFFNLFLSPAGAMALAVTLLNMSSMIFVKIFANEAVFETGRSFSGKKALLLGPLVSILSLSLFYVSMLFPPGRYQPGVDQYYANVFTPNPFHNATYLAARPFTILAFAAFIRLLPLYEQGWHKHWKKEVWFGLFLLLATMTKPSFTLVFVASAGLLMAYRLIRSGGKNLLPTLQLTIFFLPTFVHLLYQYQGVFVPTPGEVGGIGIGFAAVWQSGNLLFAIGKAIAFPALVLVFHIRQIRNNETLKFTWLLYLVGLIMFLFLYEKGFRKEDMNFSWGYMCGLFFLFLESFLLLLRESSEALRDPHPIKTLALPAVQWMVFGWHLVCGLIYFMGIYQGYSYF